ncbi:MAG TPA: HAD family phosphatase [Verrucomicrobiae bacterium]
MKPTVVVFDLGKVLLDFDYGIMTRQLEPLCRIKGKELKLVIDQSPLLHRYETGLITTPELFGEFVSTTGYSGSLAQFKEAFADIFSEIPAMVELHAQLHQRGVSTFIFSNTNELAVGHVQRKFPFFAKFTGYVYSHEVKAMKPAPKIYEAVEAMSGKRGAEILYIDDRLENVEAGKARGWHTVFHQDPSETRMVVEGHGLVK